MSHMSFADAALVINTLRDRINQAVFGQEKLVDEALACFLAGGHLLMTGAPGLAKTTLVRVIARQLHLKFGRIQFTPDLLPSDIIGSDVLHVDPATQVRDFRFVPGPIFANLVLADEINRASPRTQSAMLEVMQERSCTVGNAVHRAPHPFMVFATQNPFESEGTFPLPEAQLDRFLIHAIVSYPAEDAERRMLQEHVSNRLVGEIRDEAAEAGINLDFAAIEKLMAATKRVTVDDDMIKVVSELVRATRPDDPSCPEDLRRSLWYGAGPRAGIALLSVSRAAALMDGSECVRWQHIQRMALPVLRHRVRLNAQAMRDKLTEDALITRLLTRLETQYAFLAKGIA